MNENTVLQDILTGEIGYDIFPGVVVDIFKKGNYR
jgi:hypothetical protein